jgi:hypothetical protein
MASVQSLPPSPITALRTIELGAGFWESMGYTQVRTREGVAMGKLTHTLRVMAKPLRGHTIEELLTLAPRDRPDGASST